MKRATSKKTLHRSRALVEVAQLEQRVLCSAVPHPAVPWLSPVHTGIVHHRTYGVSGRPPTGLSKPATFSGKPTANSLVAPSGLTASLKTSTSSQLNWNGSSGASGYYVLRSVDGGGYSRLASIGSATTTSYVDSGLSAGHTYSYEVQAYSGKQTSTVSNAASVTTQLVAPAAPTSLFASPAGSFVSLGWSEADTTTAGYLVFRSTDGANFTQFANLTSPSSTNTVDTAVSAGQVYYYEVEAYNAAGVSGNSNIISITAPAAQTGGGVSIGYRFANELVVNATGTSDSIAVSQSGSTLNITADGLLSSYPVPAAGLFIYTRGGSDGIRIDNTVSAAATVMSIDGATTAVSSSGSNVNVWMDSTDSFTGSGASVHKVASFAGGVSKAVGAALADPSDAGSTFQANLSLFGTGPVADDVNQGSVGDCYFLATLAGFATSRPSVLTGSAVDMGDGTYTVQFMRNGAPTFVRVSNDLSTGPWGGFNWAHPGANGTIWAPIIEKAFCYFRYGSNSYASIGGGSLGEGYGDFGVSASGFAPSSYTASAFYTMISNDLSKHEAVTMGTFSSAPNLVSNHVYSLVNAYVDSNGATWYVVRNPWGFSGNIFENSLGYATLSFAQVVANFTQGGQAIG